MLSRAIAGSIAAAVLLVNIACFGDEGNLDRSQVPNWQPMGCGMGGNTYWLTIDPSDDKTVYWSPDMGGLFKTSDGGKHWKSIGAEFLHSHRGNDTSLVTVAPSESDVVYAYSQLRIGDLPANSSLAKKYGSGRHLGLIQSQDGGETWRAIKEPAHRLGAIAVDPNDANTVWQSDSLCLRQHGRDEER
jgi:hypothetical protein